MNIHGEEGSVLLYAHGFGCDQRMWDGMLPAFASSHKQVLFDYVGSGQSDLNCWTHDRYSKLDGYAQDIVEVCDALELSEGVTLIGHSVSASIALLASIERPGLFSDLILVGPNPCFINDPPKYKGGFDRADLEGLLELMDQNHMGWADYLAPVVSGSDPNNDVTLRLQDSFCTTDPKVSRTFAKATFFADNRSDLASVQTPSLILQHSRDNLVPIEIGEYLHNRLDQSVLRFLDVPGHCAHMSHPDLVAAEVRDYLKLV